MSIYLVIHLDPIETKDEETMKVRGFLEEVVKNLDSKCSIHDFRMVDGPHQINLIFDMIVPINYDKEQRKALCKQVRKAMQEVDERYQCVIVVESSYIAEE